MAHDEKEEDWHYANHDPEFAIRETRAMLPQPKATWYVADRQMKKLSDMLEKALLTIELLQSRCEAHERMLAEKGVMVFNPEDADE
jgi:hypothetical protein